MDTTSDAQGAPTGLPRCLLPLTRSAKAGAAFVAIYAALIYLPFLGSNRTLTAHEVMVTHPAMRILTDGDWIVPRYAGGWWLDKPPLVNWITAISFQVLGGFSEFAARLPIALSTIALCVGVYLLADRFYSRSTAILAGLVQATCVYTYMQGRLGEIDMVFALLLFAAQAVLAAHWGKPVEEKPARYKLPIGASMLFYCFAALAVLAKGLLAVVLIAFTVMAFCLWQRSWRPILALVVNPGVPLFLLIAGGWHVAAYLQVGQEALEQWGYNTLDRFTGDDFHLKSTKSPVFYFYTIPWLMAPWSLVLIAGANRLIAQVRRPDARFEKFLWSWFFGGFVFITICSFRHKHYAIPILPPLSILAGYLIDTWLTWTNVHVRRIRVGTWVAFPIIFGIVAGVVMPARDHRRETAEFIQQATASLPDEATLYVIGLGQSSAYPYIEHDKCAYLDSADAIRDALESLNGGPMYVLTRQMNRMDITESGATFTELDSERVRRKYDWRETHTVGTLTKAPAATTTSPE